MTTAPITSPLLTAAVLREACGLRDDPDAISAITVCNVELQLAMGRTQAILEAEDNPYARLPGMIMAVAVGMLTVTTGTLDEWLLLMLVGHKLGNTSTQAAGVEPGE